MNEWFSSREPRERLILAVGAFVALVIVAWGFVWRPLSNGVERLQASVEDKTVLLVDVQRAAAIQPESTPRATANQSLVALVDRTSRAHGVAGALGRQRPDGANAINVEFRGAAFDDLLAWLIELEREHGVTIMQSSVTSTRDQGRVNGSLLLQRH